MGKSYGFVGRWWTTVRAAARWSSRRLHRWNSIIDGAAVVRGERGEGEERQKRGRKEKKRERERKRGTSPPLVASLERFAGREENRKSDCSFLWRRRRINCLRVLGSLV
ncbi:hypothetical protein H5410_005768 [Solanum commersonii]|uniref:Uncharacterized protein n=1 Tax=Solanum commersonii TaxID=4109 RepID=A0A9J6A7C4_SOLCO|nr:hypothetical protein H5410_005768 [Solanum commersonii]